MKYPKITVLLAITLLLAASPAHTISWDSFKWNNIKQNALKVGTALGLGAVAYWTANKIKNYRLFPALELQPGTENTIKQPTEQLEMKFSEYCNQIENSKHEDNLTLTALAEIFEVNIKRTNISCGPESVDTFICEKSNAPEINAIFNPYSQLRYATKNNGYISQFNFILAATNEQSIIMPSQLRIFVADYIRKNPKLKAKFMETQKT
mgnify:FL=1